MRKLILFWITWALVWILGMVGLRDLGLIAYSNTGWIIADAIIDIIAAVIFTLHPFMMLIGGFSFTALLVFNFSFIMLICYLMSMLLLYVTKKVLKG